ncbi:hypothetical protein AVEN_183490-1 [Araneus ventricosus]|uniref:Uncharacterized protein n=1 Tax=Araneus ventricosus TaxID=182803 RepID=A0A4Y2IUC6_ARAVE|nr:hypothetical protein AVEN_174184-1 [Araneus ventricosus]GBM81488.1 hypothetical protein AVEN_183490-1 [Araneus ventricosus]
MRMFFRTTTGDPKLKSTGKSNTDFLFQLTENKNGNECVEVFEGNMSIVGEESAKKSGKSNKRNYYLPAFGHCAAIFTKGSRSLSLESSSIMRGGRTRLASPQELQ